MSIVYIVLSCFVFLLLLLAAIPITRRAVFQKPWLTIIIKNLYTFIGKPYFKVTIFHHREVGQSGVDAQYNVHFVYLLDGVYEAARVSYYNRGLSEEAKVAIYLYDTIGSIAEAYMPMPTELSDAMEENIPPMSLRDGEPVKQVVDLGKQQQSDLDVIQG